MVQAHFNFMPSSYESSSLEVLVPVRLSDQTVPPSLPCRRSARTGQTVLEMQATKEVVTVVVLAASVAKLVVRYPLRW
jgi:hypothetical protein